MSVLSLREHRREKENMAEFISKKREMFLVQMSLDTKRAEIRKLEEQAQQREEVRLFDVGLNWMGCCGCGLIRVGAAQE
jgi:hypothetical protein